MKKMHFFLANFGTWKSYHGVESNILIRENFKNPIRKQYLKNVIFHQNYLNWNFFYNDKKHINLLSYPQFGNQCGAYIDGNFVGVGSFFNEIYGSILNGIISNIFRPVVADLGAGYGKLGYFSLLLGCFNFNFICGNCQLDTSKKSLKASTGKNY